MKLRKPYAFKSIETVQKRTTQMSVTFDVLPQDLRINFSFFPVGLHSLSITVFNPIPWSLLAAQQETRRHKRKTHRQISGLLKQLACTLHQRCYTLSLFKILLIRIVLEILFITAWVSSPATHYITCALYLSF